MCTKSKVRPKTSYNFKLITTGKNLDTYTSLMNIHTLMPVLHGRCYSIDCWHQTVKAGKKYTCRYECLAIMEARPTPKYPKKSLTHLQSYRRKTGNIKRLLCKRQESKTQWSSWAETSIHTHQERQAASHWWAGDPEHSFTGDSTSTLLPLRSFTCVCWVSFSFRVVLGLD